MNALDFWAITKFSQSAVIEISFLYTFWGYTWYWWYCIVNVQFWEITFINQIIKVLPGLQHFLCLVNFAFRFCCHDTLWGYTWYWWYCTINVQFWEITFINQLSKYIARSSIFLLFGQNFAFEISFLYTFWGYNWYWWCGTITAWFWEITLSIRLDNQTRRFEKINTWPEVSLALLAINPTLAS